jgi:hypothetical protein
MEDNMVTRKLARSLLLLGLLFPLLIGVTTVNASPGNCSQATLKGKYGSLEQGTVVANLGDGFPAPPFPVALTAIDTYDGKGNVSGTYWASFDGVPVSGPFKGTYTVNPDCTYSDTITPEGQPPSHRVGTITGEGLDQELQTIYTDAWLVAYGTAKKTLPWGCSLRTLKGTYEVFGQGSDISVPIPIPGFPSPPFPAAHVGIFTADGAGHFSGKDVEKVDVVAAPTTFTATYTVNPDCTVSVIITEHMGPYTMTIPEIGTITGWGESQEVHLIIFTEPDLGWVFVDMAKKQ